MRHACQGMILWIDDPGVGSARGSHRIVGNRPTLVAAWGRGDDGGITVVGLGWTGDRDLLEFEGAGKRLRRIQTQEAGKETKERLGILGTMPGDAASVE